MSANKEQEKTSPTVDEQPEEEESMEVEDEPKAATPSTGRRGGNRRSRKRRGGRRSAPAVPPSGNQNDDDKTPLEDEKVKTEEIQDGEIEVTQNKEGEETVEVKTEDNSEEQREPSPVMTRRSNRKIVQQQKQEVSETDLQIPIDDIKDEDRPSTAASGAALPLESMDQDEVESVTSELDSIASGSTLTTRSRRRGGGPGSQESLPKGKKSSRMAQRKNGNHLNGGGVATNGGNTKGKSRRIIFKKSATKAPTAVAKAVTSDRVYYRNQYFTKGDIVSVEDVDGSVYYAQLRGFLTDQYCEKSGVITWLLPTVNSPPPEDRFDPSTYVIGPEEDLPRKLEFFTFVMHAPDDYFYYRKAPYPTISVQTDQEYLVTRQGPRVRMIKAGKPVYQETVPPLIPINSS